MHVARGSPHAPQAVGKPSVTKLVPTTFVHNFMPYRNAVDRAPLNKLPVWAPDPNVHGRVTRRMGVAFQARLQSLYLSRGEG